MLGDINSLRGRLGLPSSGDRDRTLAAVQSALLQLGYQVSGARGSSQAGSELVRVESIRFGRVVLSSAPSIAAGLRLDTERIVSLASSIMLADGRLAEGSIRPDKMARGERAMQPAFSLVVEVTPR